MRTRIKQWWDRYEHWLAPMTVFIFCALGIQIGIILGKNIAQKEFNDQVGALNAVISSQNERIADKDQRLRMMQDLQLEERGKLGDALKSSTDAAKSSADSAKASAESVKVLHESPNPATPKQLHGDMSRDVGEPASK